MHRATVFLATGLISFAAAAAELEDGTFLFDTGTPVPAGVLALEECGAEDNPFATRQPFAGGFVFAIQCPGNNENFNQTLVFADNAQGSGARLLRFPGPGKRREGFEDVLSNVRWSSDSSEIGEIFVDREVEERADPEVCRTEGRWRLEGKPPEPKLVFWRETPDCAGKRGWKVVIGEQGDSVK